MWLPNFHGKTHCNNFWGKRKTITSYTMEHECADNFALFVCCQLIFNFCAVANRPELIMLCLPVRNKRKSAFNQTWFYYITQSGWPGLFCINEIIQNLQTFFCLFDCIIFTLRHNLVVMYLFSLLMNIEYISIETSDFIIFSWQFKST